MKKIAMFTFLASLFSFLSFVSVSAQNSDPIRDQLKWDRLAAPSNDNNEIEKLYFGYTRPDGKHFDIIAELPFAIAADQFNGGWIKEDDINFDGIPDLQISLGSLNGIGAFTYEGYVWNPSARQFNWVEDFRQIINPEVSPGDKVVIGHELIENIMSLSEWRWEGRGLVLTDLRYENNDDYTPTDAERRMQSEALVGEWQWAVDGELPSEIQLCLSLDCEDGMLYVSECTIYGSTATFDIDCTYSNGIMKLMDAPGLAPGMSSLSAQLRLNPRGDLVGFFRCRVGENKSKGTVTLRMQE